MATDQHIDFKSYLKKLDIVDIEKYISQEDIQNCIQTISYIEDEEVSQLSKSDYKLRGELISVSSSSSGTYKREKEIKQQQKRRKTKEKERFRFSSNQLKTE